MNNQFQYAFNSPSIQKALNLFAFLLAFPGIEVLENSLYFYVFLLILYKTYKRTGRAFRRSRFVTLLTLSWVLGLISTIFHPTLIPDSYTTSGTVVMVIRYAYWFAIGAYFYSWLKYINVVKLAKWISIGYIIQVIGFYVLSFKIDAGVFSFNTALSRNAFVFNSILFSGMLFYYFFMRFGNKSFWPVALFVLFNLLLTNGRAGAVIAVLIVLLNYALINPGVRRLSKLFVVVLIGLSFFTQDLEAKAYAYGALAAPYVESFSPRFANLLRGVDEGDLEFDKSWLHRELMVDKTIEIISERPFLGVGYGNFTNYSASLNTFESIKYSRLRGHSVEYYNTRSAHNSYANHLAETGIIGFLILLSLIVPLFLWFLKQYWVGSMYYYGLQIFIIIGLIGALIHGYAIASFTGANMWFMLGIGHALIKHR